MSAAPLTSPPFRPFTDNYIWLLERGGPACAVVDPGDHEPVLEALKQRGLDLRYILLTHHHWDHAGGVEACWSTSHAEVFGPDDERLGDWCQPCARGRGGAIARSPA